MGRVEAVSIPKSLAQLSPEFDELSSVSQGQEHDLGSGNATQGAANACLFTEAVYPFAFGPGGVKKQWHGVPGVAGDDGRGGMVTC